MKRIHFKNESDLVAAVTSGRLKGRAVHVLVLHDDACGPSNCQCAPEFIVESYKHGQAEMRKWIDKSRQRHSS